MTTSLVKTIAILMAAGVSTAPALAQATGEAPALAEKVAAGELPPVAERVSNNPEVLAAGKPGVYGGTIRFGIAGTSDDGTVNQMIGGHGLVRWSMSLAEIVPNIAASYEVSEDAREYTFHLREGAKWSDGKPFTTEDVAVGSPGTELEFAL